MSVSESRCLAASEIGGLWHHQYRPHILAQTASSLQPTRKCKARLAKLSAGCATSFSYSSELLDRLARAFVKRIHKEMSGSYCKLFHLTTTFSWSLVQETGKVSSYVLVDHTITQRLPMRRCVILTGGSCRLSNPANLGTTKQSLSSASSALLVASPLLLFVFEVSIPLALALMVGVVSSTREKVHKGLPSVGSQAVLILVTAANKRKDSILC